MKKGRVKKFIVGALFVIFVSGILTIGLIFEGSGNNSLFNINMQAYVYQIGLLYSDGTSEIVEHKVKIVGVKSPEIKLSPNGCVYAVNAKGEKEFIACYVKRFLVFKVGTTRNPNKAPKRQKRRSKIINI